MTVLLWVLAGLAVAGGLVALVVGVVGTTAPKGPTLSARLRAGRQLATRDERMARRTRLIGGALAGVLLWLVSGVFIAGVMVFLAVIGVPWLLSPTKSATARIAKLESLGDWTQRLANVLRLGRGLDEALQVSRRGCPEAIAGEVADLVDRLQVGWRPTDALREFGDALNDVTADKVVAALVLSAADRGPGLAQALEDLAESVHEEVARRRAIESDRAKPRTTMRWMTIITLGVIGCGFLIPSYTAPYGTLLGQLVLAVLLTGFVGVLALMRQIADIKPVPRFLIADPRSAVAPAPAPDTEESTMEVSA
ncbi:type II secretion system F family protein [Streptomyces sp. NBC_00536]|uniref:type II secretion system F family protein n=1 Tax=Streptomyces sp. NBC_00536 TaxID=2975769 RepID=UPI002E813883|nr:type II secretion system F family protein [Streptomyces sp. NBC_00536]WUC83444.1 type II secretion system F family protein [Streptomyces sp. NBC_00536]